MTTVIPSFFYLDGLGSLACVRSELIDRINECKLERILKEAVVA
jgi:hypothetical protein